MSFFRYFVRRLLLVIPILLGITVVAFIIANAIPADPINANLPPTPSMTKRPSPPFARSGAWTNRCMNSI